MRIVVVLAVAVAVAPGVHCDEKSVKPDTPEQIAAKFAAIAEHNRPVFALRSWGESIVAQVKRVKLVPKEKPKDQPGFVAGFVWPITEPDVYDMFTVDVAEKTMSKLTVPGLKEVIRLSMDGQARVAFGYDDKGASVLRREKGDGWEDVPLPKGFVDAKQRILVQSDTTLALMTLEAIHVRDKAEWRTTALPKMPNDSLNRPRPIEWAVTPKGRHFGKNFYVDWQETEINGCLLAIDLEAKRPEWKNINGTEDRASGLPDSYLVAAIRQGPKGSLWVARDGEYVGEDVYRFDGKEWQKHWTGPRLSDYRLIDMTIGPKGECFLLSARPPAQVLRVEKEKTDSVLSIPGMAMSILADRQGNLLVGTMGHDLILCEKVGGGFRIHHVAPKP